MDVHGDVHQRQSPRRPQTATQMRAPLPAGSPMWSVSGGPEIVVKSANLTRGWAVERNMVRSLLLLLARNLLTSWRLLTMLHQALRRRRRHMAALPDLCRPDANQADCSAGSARPQTEALTRPGWWRTCRVVPNDPPVLYSCVGVDPISINAMGSF